MTAPRPHALSLRLDPALSAQIEALLAYRNEQIRSLPGMAAFPALTPHGLVRFLIGDAYNALPDGAKAPHAPPPEPPTVALDGALVAPMGQGPSLLAPEPSLALGARQVIGQVLSSIVPDPLIGAAICDRFVQGAPPLEATPPVEPPAPPVAIGPPRVSLRQQHVRDRLINYLAQGGNLRALARSSGLSQPTIRDFRGGSALIPGHLGALARALKAEEA